MCLKEPFWIQPTCNVSFHSFQGELAMIIVKLYGFWIVFRRVVYDLISATALNFGAKIVIWSCSASVKHIAFSVNKRTCFVSCFMFCCICVVIFISKACNNGQILQTVHEIVGYHDQVGDLIRNQVIS